MNKREELDHLVYSTKTDVVGTESWLTPDIKDHEVFPPDFTVYCTDREIGQGGGVFIAIRAGVVTTKEEDLETECKLLSIKLNIASSNSLCIGSIGAYYKPNATDEQNLNSLAQSLAKLPRDSSHVWLAGDMNLSGLDSVGVAVNSTEAHLLFSFTTYPVPRYPSRQQLDPSH